MKIIHYFLGFPPYRTGGMTKFAVDLMQEQKNRGNEVIALWPGRINIICKRTNIKKRKKNNGIISYEIINPLPVPLDEGIKDTGQFMQQLNSNCYEKFLKKIQPDVIHIHTLMGLHKEFIDVANKLKIKTIYTTHDYFGICPKVILYKNKKICNDDHNCEDCRLCNSNALSISKIKILQSPIYKMLKNTSLVKALRKKHRKDFFYDENIVLNNKSGNKDYIKLRNYYINMLQNISLIHFNSTLTFNIYNKFLKPKSYKILNISNKEISDNRNIKHINSDKIRYTYLASNKEYKGYFLLKQVLDDLWNNSKDFKLNIYCDAPNASEYMDVYKNGFTRDELKNIFSNTDILIAPSKWCETFGYTVLEALSYGVPVIVSDTVGANEIVNDAGLIFKNNDTKDLKNVISKIDKEEIDKLRNNVKKIKLMTWERFYNECMNMYKEGIKQ